MNQVEAPRPPPPQPPMVRAFVPTPRRRASNVLRLLLRGVILVVILIVAAVQYFAKHGGSSLTDQLGVSIVGVAGMEWEGVHGVILADVNGDHVPDIVGRLRYVIGGDRVTLGAFDGQSGSKLWESDPIGTYSQTYQGSLGLAEDALLFALPNGEVSAFALHDGKKHWTSSLPEKASGFCKGDHAGDVRIRLADQRLVELRLSDGQAIGAPAPAPTASRALHGKEKESESCARLASDDGRTGDPNYEVRGASSYEVPVEGMTVRAVVQRAGGPRIALGTREKGTSVPMIAAVFEDASRNWKSDLASTRPLETGPYAPELGAVTASRAFTEYGYTDTSKPHTLVCFDLGGHRQWEVALPIKGHLSAIQATDQRVFVSQWGRISAYDASTGKAVFSIGK